MPYNGSGVYQPPTGIGYPATPGAVITSALFNGVVVDLASALSLCITRDGQGVPTSNINWGGQKITNLANAALGLDAANLQTVQAQVLNPTGNVNYTYSSVAYSILGLNNLTGTGAISMASMALSGNATIGGTLGVTGLITASGGLSVPGTATIGTVAATAGQVANSPLNPTDIINLTALQSATAVVNLGQKVVYVSGATTLVGSGYTVLADTTSGPYTITLPTQTVQAYPTIQTPQTQIGFQDVLGTWGVNNLTIAPATGQQFMKDIAAVNETLICDVSDDAFVCGWTNQDWRFM